MIRTKNISGRESCAYCRETGFVVAEGPDENGYDCAYAPCPFCEAGYREEFPEVNANEKHRIRTPWHPESGYWQGKPTAHLVPERKGPEYHLSREEQKEHLRAMGKVLGWALRSVDEEIEPRKATPA